MESHSRITCSRCIRIRTTTTAAAAATCTSLVVRRDLIVVVTHVLFVVALVVVVPIQSPTHLPLSSSPSITATVAVVHLLLLLSKHPIHSIPFLLCNTVLSLFYLVSLTVAVRARLHSSIKLVQRYVTKIHDPLMPQPKLRPEQTLKMLCQHFFHAQIVGGGGGGVAAVVV